MSYFETHTSENEEAGYTLLELLVVLAILALIIGVTTPMIVNQFSQAKADTARIQVNKLTTELEFFLLDMGRFPSEAEGLDALLVSPADATGWNGPYVAKSSQIQDPWNNPYGYRYFQDTNRVEITSLGADGVEGGSGENADISSLN